MDDERRVNIFARHAGAIIAISGHGEATFEVPCSVPESVAVELATNPRLRVDDAPAQAQPTAADAAARAEPQPPTYHARRGAVYHTREDCPVGNNIEAATRRNGDAGLPLCDECARLNAGTEQER